MDVFKEDSDVFEITDFTTASDWERFIAALEEVLIEWKMGDKTRAPSRQKDDLITGIWKQEKEDISFADFKFSVTHHFLVVNQKKEKNKEDVSSDEVVSKEEESTHVEEEDENMLPATFEDIMNSTNDFPGKAHCLVRWFGVRDFIIIACATRGEFISSESRVKILLSSMNIAINNTGCSVPIFLEVDKPQRQLYTGICEGGGMKIDFDTASLKRIPHHLQFMSGLVDMFQKKLGCSVTESPKITVAVRITFILNTWPLHMSPCIFPDTAEPIDYRHLSVGPLQDPISDLVVSTTWPRVDSIMVADSDVYSDLDPMSAPQWHLRIAYVDQPQCNLCESIRQFVKLCKRRETMNELFKTRSDDGAGHGAQASYQPNLSKAFERLTEPRVQVPNITTAVRNATAQLRRLPMENAPLDDSFVDELMQFIFSEDESKFYYKKNEIEETNTIDTSSSGGRRSISSLNDADLTKCIEKQLKCAPLSSITHRMAVCFCCLNRESGGIYAVAQLWHEVLVELRTRWEAGLYIPDLSADAYDTAPDLGTSLFHQKLQMINCCISRKIARETCATAEIPLSELMGKGGSETSEDDDDDEFYECNQEMSAEDSTKVSPESFRPTGRKERFGSHSLLGYPDIPLFIPFTQEAAPMTEDALEELAKKLTGLGSSEESTSMRARMQSASLVSDMESFKAANPKSCLIDFVRWYSPRDFIYDAETGGKLSQRMEVPGNLWVEAWNEAKYVSAKHQKRLLDDTAEAEKVFRFLENLSPADLCLSLMPNVFAESILELYRYCRLSFVPPPDIIPVLDTLRERTGFVTRKVNLQSGFGTVRLPEYEEIIRRVAHAEILLSRSRSLQVKFLRETNLEEDLDNLAPILHQCLSEVPDVSLVGAARGPMGQALQRLMLECQIAEGEESATKSEEITPKFSEPAGKEYILRAHAPMPSPYSRPGPQRLYCAVRRDDYRLCGAFSKDTMFF